MTRLTQSAVTARADKHTGARTGDRADQRDATPARPARAGRPARTAPVRRLTVLYDPACRLCAFVRDWLARQRQLVKLDLVPVGSPEAMRRFPGLDQAAATREITVVGDSGQLYRGDSAWVVCLWALADHRALSHTLATPAGRKLARAAVLAAARYRESRRQAPGRSAGRSGGRDAAGAGAGVRIAPGWTYDKATGWTLRAGSGDGSGGGDVGGGGGGRDVDGGGDACADGCATGG
jgi:predicted DCC family thiol-disulfide oxidoreductase YuxK